MFDRLENFSGPEIRQTVHETIISLFCILPAWQIEIEVKSEKRKEKRKTRNDFN